MILVSFIIPTLNAGKVLKKCFVSIRHQTIKNIEIIIADGGSVDNTLSVAKKYKVIITNNPLKTAEAGKAVGLKKAKGKFVALIDSDNILPSKYWIKTMLEPLIDDQGIVISEPWKFTYRPHAGFIERYSALIGANDPYAWYTGVYDRYSYLTDKWTGLKLDQIDFPQYLKVILKPNQILPTIGANGTIFRTDFLKKNQTGNYLFDIDIISSFLNRTHVPINIAKVKIGIIHTFCEASINKFIRKQKRRLIDYYNYLPYRQYKWSATNKTGIIRFTIYTLLLLPPIFDSIRGYLKKPDLAWFFHPIACLLSFFIFTQQSILFLLKINRPLNRQLWSQ